MISLVDLLVRVSEDLEECEIGWALIGGLAVGVRAEPRFTRDVDLAVDVADDAGAERLVHSLRERGYEVAAVLEHVKTGRLATVRLLPDFDDRLVDLLFASSGIESQIVEKAERIELRPHTFAPVAALGHLIAMKVLARDDESRPQDRMDLIALVRAGKKADFILAREALAQIVQADFHRGRSLLSELDATLEELGASD